MSGLVAIPCAWPLASAPGAWTVTDEMKDPDHAPLAEDEVNYMGDAVAVVVASDRYTAQDALEFIEVDYEPLDVVTDMEEALEEGSPLVHEELGTNQCYTWELGDNGDVDEAFSKADVVIKERYIQQRLIPNAIEPRAVVAQREPGQAAGTWCTRRPRSRTSPRPFSLWRPGLPEQQDPGRGPGRGRRFRLQAQRLRRGDSGPGPGTKLRTCRSSGSRTARRTTWRPSTGAARSRTSSWRPPTRARSSVCGSKVTGRHGRVPAALNTAGIPLLGAFMYPGVYTFGAYSFECTGVFTNLTPTDAYRGAGRPEAAFAVERIMDALAHELDMDPAEVRRKNFYEPFDEPTTTPAGIQYDSCNLPGCSGPGDGARRLRGACGRSSGAGASTDDPVQLGIGFSTYTEICGLAPSQVLRPRRPGGAGWEIGQRCRMLASGKVEVITGTSPHGQGHVTSWSQIAADVLGRHARTTWRSCTATRPSPPTGATPTARAASPSAASRFTWRPRRSWRRPRR